jgi:hypothetical protein
MMIHRMVEYVGSKAPNSRFDRPEFEFNGWQTQKLKACSLSRGAKNVSGVKWPSFADDN